MKRHVLEQQLLCSVFDVQRGDNISDVEFPLRFELEKQYNETNGHFGRDVSLDGLSFVLVLITFFLLNCILHLADYN